MLATGSPSSIERYLSQSLRFSGLIQSQNTLVLRSSWSWLRIFGIRRGPSLSIAACFTILADGTLDRSWLTRLYCNIQQWKHRELVDIKCGKKNRLWTRICFLSYEWENVLFSGCYWPTEKVLQSLEACHWVHTTLAHNDNTTKAKQEKIWKTLTRLTFWT